MKIRVILLAAVFLLLNVGTVMASELPGLSEIIGDEATAPPETEEEWDGRLPNVSGDATNNEALTEPFETLLGKATGFLFPALAGLITAALMLRILLDLLYLVAPFARKFMLPGGEAQTGGSVGGYSGMGMQNQMHGNQMGPHGGSGRSQTGIQWVSESAIQAVAQASQIGPNGKPGNVFAIYPKSMIIPLILVPVMLVLIFNGALTNVGNFIGNFISDAINGRVAG